MGKPIGVALHRADGTVLNCELVHEGTDATTGADCWRIANAVYHPGDHITVEELPANTTIGFSAPHRLIGMDLEWGDESGQRRSTTIAVDYPDGYDDE